MWLIETKSRKRQFGAFIDNSYDVCFLRVRETPFILSHHPTHFDDPCPPKSNMCFRYAFRCLFGSYQLTEFVRSRSFQVSLSDRIFKVGISVACERTCCVFLIFGRGSEMSTRRCLSATLSPTLWRCGPWSQPPARDLRGIVCNSGWGGLPKIPNEHQLRNSAHGVEK